MKIINRHWTSSCSKYRKWL